MKFTKGISAVILLTAVVVIGVIVLGGMWTRKQPQSSTSDVLRSMLQREFALHYNDSNSKQFGGLMPEDISFTLEPLDVNGDSNTEYLVTGVQVRGTFMGGASGNQEMPLYQRQGSEWKKIAVLDGNGYDMRATKTTGYFDLRTTWHNSVFSSTEYIYTWDASTGAYKQSSSREIVQ